MSADVAGKPDPTASETRWSFGDRVVHARRPEWGTGTITAAEPSVVDGRPTQRLTIRFDRAGLKKLAASAAALNRADQHAPSVTPAPSNGPAPDPELSDAELSERLLAIPEPARDPFRSLAERFEASIRLYRYSSQGGSLLDWAAAQTGLADPLSTCARHELEAAFERFRRRLDTHTRSLALDIVKSDPAAAKRILADAPEGARLLMRRIAGRR